MKQQKRLAELLSRTDYWSNQAVFDEAEAIYRKLLEGKMERIKRDRTNEVYGDYTIIKPTSNPREWIARCKCGYERTVKNESMSKLSCCKSCAAKLRMKKRVKPKKDKFTEMKNWMRPKRPKFKYDVLYELDCPQCVYSCEGKLVNEYSNAASFEIVKCNSIDEKVVAKLNRRVNLKKKDVYDLCQRKKLEK